ncbi:trimethylamine methyltransferase family protein [Acetobacterium bakii]|uniref:trimethylamine methyltransferase family protein n=1 Tax=Acetobacterium bakii TaxID=52689 RepID=UPI00241E7B52|nr:trimethylamine methyltransferase family protein [Acetobacterium bakii]
MFFNHEYTLKVMNEVGVIVEHETALELFKKHGARVEGNTVYFSEELLNKALSTIPQEIEVFTGRQCQNW